MRMNSIQLYADNRRIFSYRRLIDLQRLTLSSCVFFQEIANALQNLRQGIEELRRSRTFKYILATLLAIGNSLNNVPVSRLTDCTSHICTYTSSMLFLNCVASAVACAVPSTAPAKYRHAIRHLVSMLFTLDMEARVVDQTSTGCTSV